MIVGLVPCDDGRIWLDDRELTGLPMHRRARLGLATAAGGLGLPQALGRGQHPRDPRTRDDLDDDSALDAALESLLEELHIATSAAAPG